MSESAHRPRRSRRALRWLLALLVIALLSVLTGVGTASAEGNLGPHRARYDVTWDGAVTVDLGPLGALVVDSPLPLTLGAHVVVQEIPWQGDDTSGPAMGEALAADLDEYVQFFSAPQATIDVAARALVADAARRSVALALTLTSLTWIATRVLGRRRRAEIARTLRPALLPVAVAAVTVGTLAGVVLLARPDRPHGATSRVFDGTALEGAVITGRLSGIVDTYGGQILDAYRANEAFYALAARNLAASPALVEPARWPVESRTAHVPAPLVDAAASVDATPLVDETTPDAMTPPVDDAAPDGTPTEAPTAEESATPTPTTTPSVTTDPIVALVVSDLHCNVGMAGVIRTAIEATGAALVLNGGDTTMNGTEVEAYCITAFAQAIPAGVPVVVADGNHDSAVIAGKEAGAGWTVLGGSVVEVAGLRILGDADPYASRVGRPTSLVGDETRGAIGTRLAETACADDAGVDLMLVHHPLLGGEALRRGCAPAQVSGHLHSRIGPEPSGEGVRYVSASTAGAAEGAATVGPLSATAELTVLAFDPDSRRITGYQVIHVHADGSVTVDAPAPWATEEMAVGGDGANEGTDDGPATDVAPDAADS